MKVKELITRLEGLPSEVEVVIDDADTGWLLVLQDVYADEKERYVVIVGEYREIYKDQT